MQERQYRGQRERGREEDYGYRPQRSYDEEAEFDQRQRDRWQREGGRGYDQESGGWGGQGRQMQYPSRDRIPSSTDYGYGAGGREGRGREYGSRGGWQGQRGDDYGGSRGRGERRGGYGPEARDQREWDYTQARPGSNFTNPSGNDQDRGYGRDSRYSRSEHDEGRQGWGGRMGGYSGEMEPYGHRASGGFSGSYEGDYEGGGFGRTRYMDDERMAGYSAFGAPGYNPSSSRGYAGRGPKGYRRSDDSIKEDVCERLSYHPRIDASEIEVDVRGGEVTLRGKVDDRNQKRMAEDAIEAVNGVTDVTNQLRVQPNQSNWQFGQGDRTREMASNTNTSAATQRSVEQHEQSQPRATTAGNSNDQTT